MAISLLPLIQLVIAVKKYVTFMGIVWALGDGPWEACSPGFLGLGTTVDVFG